MNVDTQKLNIPMKEKLKSIPEMFGIRMNEEPDYRVLMKDNDFEVRHYPQQLIAKVSLQGLSFDDFREKAFKKLAHYIFDGDETQIAMTSPVLQEESEVGGWTMSFILPSEYNIINAPKPEDSEIKLEEVRPYEVASIAYSGNNTLEKIKMHERKLSDWLKTQDHIQSVGHFMVAQYDAPFVIPFLKKNEIHMRVKTVH